MAVKLPSFKLLPAAGAKSRILVLMLALAAAGVGIYFLVRYLGGAATPTGASRVAAAPAGLQSVPGGQSSPEYYRAVVAANAEASRQAQMTGGSAVPTLLNVPVAQPVYQQPQQNCTILCPSENKANVKTDIDQLVKSEKLARKDADTLLALAGKNVSVDEYAAALDKLVREGKLTPAEARALLEKYRKQHQDVLVGKGAAMMDGMIHSGKLSLEEANRLLMLQKNGISTSAYAAALKKEASEKHLAADLVSALLGEYAGQQLKECAIQDAFRLKQFVAEGSVTPAVEKELAGLQDNNASVVQYAQSLNAFVTAGKLTPATSATLDKLYRQQRACGGSSEAMEDLLRQQEALAARCVSDSVGKGGLTHEDADMLVGLEHAGVTWTRWEQAIANLQKTDRLTADEGRQVALCYKKLLAIREEIQRLKGLQANNASQIAYANELKRAVQSGVLPPQSAGDLMQEYSAMVTPVTGVVAGTEVILPGAADFAKLQQHIQENIAAGPAAGTPQAQTAQFTNVAAETAARAETEHQQRLQQLQSAMMSQAQSLLTAWQQIPTIQHVAGQVAAPKKTAGSVAQGGATVGGEGLPGKGGASAPTLPPLIKAGTVEFAVLETAVDSDYPDTPVMATIVQGPLKGARLLGKLSLAQGQDRVSLNFNLMDATGWIESKSVSAFAIDPDTARTVMATSVDHHYLLRYGALFASSFLSGYASAITQAGNSVTGIFGVSTTHPALSPANKLAVAIGQIGTNLNTAVSGYTTTPATVRIKSGVGVGILFTADVAAS